jgi:hypothetical protein
VDWERTTVFKYSGGIQEGRSRIKPGGVVVKPISALLRHPGGYISETMISSLRENKIK